MNGDAGASPTAVVTGASRGIGLEVARALVAAGFRVAMLARSESNLRARAGELGDTKLAIALPCDVADAESVSRVAQLATVQLGGPPDVLVNNAGLFKLAPVVRTDPQDFRDALDTNLVAPFLLVRAFLPAMIDRGSGHIVNIGSIADRVTFPENAAYAASKFGLRAFHEVLRTELRGTGVRASLVSPSPVDTPLWDEIDPDSRPGFTPRRLMLRASAVADAVRYVVSAPADVNVDELRLSHS
ncbi:MAG TPA: SDR family oxidoreductase [Gemmatimonadaceae bacterium]